MVPVLLILCMESTAQSSIGGVLSGSLIKPEVGVFAWYELTDTSTQSKYYLRQAVTGKEKIKRKTGYWVETQLLPEQGIPLLYRMLLTGPANDPANVHRILWQKNTGTMDEIDVKDMVDQKPEALPQEDLGEVELETFQGTMKCRHIRLKSEDDLELWLNDAVRPTGIVQAKSSRGMLVLQRFGAGGPDGAPQATPTEDETEQPQIDETSRSDGTESRSGVKRNFNNKRRTKQ